MSKKLTIEYIKEQTSIIQEGYELLSTKYIGVHSKLKFKCNRGHIFESSWGNFSHGSKCPECYNESKYLTIEYVREQTPIIQEGYKLMSTEYIGAKSKLKFKCSEGHIFSMTWDNFSQGNKCPECKKLTIEYVKEQTPIIQEGYELLSTKYIGVHSKLKFKCDRGHVFKITWNSFSQDRKCPECYNELRKLTIEYVREQIPIIQKDYELVSTEYIGAHSKLKFKCSEGHIFSMTWGNFSQGQKCPECYYINYTPEELNQLDKYRKYVISLSNRNYNKYKDIINPDNKERSNYKYHMDHIFPVIEGFRKKIPAKYLANPYNLQMLWWKKNLIKHDDPWQSEKKLYQSYEKFKIKKQRQKYLKELLK